MILKKTPNKIRSATLLLHYWMLILLFVSVMPFRLLAQGSDQNAVSNGAGLVSGGNYTGYVSAGQMGTYMFSNGNTIATQGIILNGISCEVIFTFVLNGNLTETQTLKSGSLVVRSASSIASGPPLAYANVYLIDAVTKVVFGQTQTDGNGHFEFQSVPYKNFFLTINTPDVPDEPVLLSFESNIFIKEVVVNGEVGVGGISASVNVVPNDACDPNSPDYAVWYLDQDHDGYGNSRFSVGQCSQPTGYVRNGDDCNDQNSAVNPNSVDIAGSGVDANCDGYYLWYVDADSDGFGISTTVSSTNNLPGLGESANNLDCNDANAAINPAAIDIPGSGIDANCDGILPCNIPEISNFIAPLEPVDINNGIRVSAVVTGNPFESVIWNWGDNKVSAGIYSAGIVTGSHIYNEAGVYTLSLTLTNLCGQTIHTFKYIVIFDPTSGFVTGSGTIYSPAGASKKYPNATGIASFGFVSKYDKQKLVPTGNTEFEFDAGGLKFASTKYDWLVVSGSKAKFKGSGTINGTGNYQFMISAIDDDLKVKGSPDLFRIKIWNETTGEVVYDNEMNVAIDADPTTAILKGSIVVHTLKTKSAFITSSLEADNVEPVSFNIYPNPTTGKVIVDIQMPVFVEVKLTVNSITGQQVFKENFKPGEPVRIDLSDQINGVYTVILETEGNRVVRKIILSKK